MRGIVRSSADPTRPAPFRARRVGDLKVEDYHPHVFGRLLIQSGSFWWQPLQKDWAEPNWVARQFATIPKLPLTFYLEAGIWEVDLYGNGGNIIETRRHLRDGLMAKGYALAYREFIGDHDTINWRGSLSDGLMALLGSTGH